MVTDQFLLADLLKHQEVDKTSLLYKAEQFLMNQILRRESFVQETKIGTIRVFLLEPKVSEDDVVERAGIVYIVKAVTSPSMKHGKAEVGFQKKHLDWLKEVRAKYRTDTLDTEAQGRVYWFIEDNNQYRYCDVDVIEILGREYDGDIHDGGTIFLKVCQLVPIMNYDNDPYAQDRREFMNKAGNRPEGKKDWFS